MASLMELVERVNKGELIESAQLEVYQESPNSAEKFLAHHAHAMLDLRRAHQHMLQSLEAIDYSDQKVLESVRQRRGLPRPDRPAGCAGRSSSAAARSHAANTPSAWKRSRTAWHTTSSTAASYTSDRENCQFVATQYDRAAQCIGWTAGQTHRVEQQADQDRVHRHRRCR